MIRPITFEEQIVGSRNDGGVYRNIYPHDGILWGCGMTVTSTQIEIASGMFVLGGRMIWVDGKTVFEVKNPIQNGYARLKAKIDLNAATTQEECGQFATEIEFSTTELFPGLTQEDINNTGKIYEQELAVVKIEAGNVTGIVRKLEGVGADAQKVGGKTLEQLFSMIYPVGSIYMSTNNINPSTLFGGTWTPWGTGRSIVGVDEKQAEFETAEKTGGSKSAYINSANLPPSTVVEFNNTGGKNINAVSPGLTTATGWKFTPQLYVGSSGAAHNNLQPYITCYMWKRIA